jgi:hypothetical protein
VKKHFDECLELGIVVHDRDLATAEWALEAG